MDVFLIFPKSQQAQKELGQQLAKFQADQAHGSLLFFFFQESLKQCGIIACAVGDMIDIDHFSNQPVHADILSGDHISVSAVSQFFILRDMAGQRKQLQPGKRI